MLVADERRQRELRAIDRHIGDGAGRPPPPRLWGRCKHALAVLG